MQQITALHDRYFLHCFFVLVYLLKCLIDLNYYPHSVLNVYILNLFKPAVSALKVTSKGAGLNPNAKVWQEMPVAPSEAVTNSPHWPPSDISEGETHFYQPN